MLCCCLCVPLSHVKCYLVYLCNTCKCMHEMSYVEHMWVLLSTLLNKVSSLSWMHRCSGDVLKAMRLKILRSFYRQSLYLVLSCVNASVFHVTLRADWYVHIAPIRMLVGVTPIYHRVVVVCVPRETHVESLRFTSHELWNIFMIKLSLLVAQGLEPVRLWFCIEQAYFKSSIQDAWCLGWDYKSFCWWCWLEWTDPSPILC